MDEENYLTDQDPLYVEYDVSFNSLPLENRYNTLIRHINILQRKNDLLAEEAEDTYRLWSDLSKRVLRNEELTKQLSEANKKVKELNTQLTEINHLSVLKDKEISKLTLRLLQRK